MKRFSIKDLNLGRNSHVPACTECRARKAKCSKERPSCLHCRSLNKTCIYPPKPVRTPLTREHLTTVENRVSDLEAVVEKLFPGGSIEMIIRSLLPNSHNNDGHDNPVESEQQSCMENALQQEEYLEFSTANDATIFENEEETEIAVPSDLTLPLPLYDSALASDQWDGSESFRSAEEDSYIEVYFRHYHPIFPFIHEATFMAQYRQQCLTDDPRAWPILLNAVLGMGAWCSTADVDLHTEEIFLERAQGVLQKLSILDPGSITTIQALLLLSDCNQRLGNPKASWQYLGLASRMALSLGLHKESADEDANLRPIDWEIRRRVWWTLYCFDSCASKIYGLPLLLPEDSLITAKPVSNIREEDLTDWNPDLPPERDDITIYWGLIQQSSYHRMANSIYRHLLSIESPTVGDIEALEMTIDDWHNSAPLQTEPTTSDSVPEWVTLARDRQLLCDRSLRLLIHRSVLLRWLKIQPSTSVVAQYEEIAARRCRSRTLAYARKTIKLISSLIHKGQFSKVTLSFLLYALFHAVLIPILHLKGDPTSPNSVTWLQDIAEAKDAFAHLPLPQDALARHFTTLLDYICCFPRSDDNGKETGMNTLAIKPANFQTPTNNIFGYEELRFLNMDGNGNEPSFSLSDWVHGVS